jgi:ankyrin repeat protein
MGATRVFEPLIVRGLAQLTWRVAPSHETIIKTSCATEYTAVHAPVRITKINPIQEQRGDMVDPLREFIEAACVPLDLGHGSGTLERAESILRTNPELLTSNIYTAAILGDDVAVCQFINRDRTSATAKGGPYDWDALSYLCFSRYLRLDRARSVGFVRAATALLDAGASANTGWYERNHQSEPEWESVLYGAAGVAHHPELTRLLLARGADPNDGETPYHAPETGDNATLNILIESGQLNEDSLATMLLRKADWHDYDGIKLLLEHGVDPNRMTHWGLTALQQALRRDNAIANIELMLDHGADPTLESPREGRSGVGIAARRGRGDVLSLFARRSISIELNGVDRLIAACATNDGESIHLIVEKKPQLVDEVLAEGGKLIAEFAGVGNTDGVGQLLDLGVDVAAVFREGDGYWGIAENSTALHVAAWRARHATVGFLIEHGAPIDVPDGRGRTPLALAARACVDSFWTERRSPDSVQALLSAGALVQGISSTGYDEVDQLLRRYGMDGDEPRRHDESGGRECEDLR